MKYSGRDDLLFVLLPEGTRVAGLFTHSSLPAAPVVWSRKVVKRGVARCLVVNAGMANAATGPHGPKTVATTVKIAATLAGCSPQEVCVASTGIIGEKLPTQPLKDGLHTAWTHLAKSTSWHQAAQAITTTDAFPKGAVRALPGATLVGICKGAGMIAPQMATTLGFVFTDARLPATTLHRLLTRAAQETFNAISVDGDRSTNDTLLLFATGTRRLSPTALKRFPMALQSLLQDLALQVVRDGEGAEKLIQVTVTTAASHAAARHVAQTIAQSPLVKIALGGGSPNWGRILMAVGKSGQKVNPQKLSIAIGKIVLFRNGTPTTQINHHALATAMTQRDIPLDVSLGVGRGRATVWTCDLNHNYVQLNAEHS